MSIVNVTEDGPLSFGTYFTTESGNLCDLYLRFGETTPPGLYRVSVERVAE